MGGGAYNAGSIYRMVVGKNTKYKTIHDLKGKVIATKIGSGSYKAFLSYIKAQGLKEKDFRMKNATPAAIIGAMQAGTVDAGIWFEPTISIILHKGWGRVGDSQSLRCSPSERQTRDPLHVIGAQVGGRVDEIG